MGATGGMRGAPRSDPSDVPDLRRARIRVRTAPLPPARLPRELVCPGPEHGQGPGRTFARQAFGIVGGEEPIKVRLLFEPKLAVYITERQWHLSQEFRVRPDGRVEMRLETTGRKELVRWVLSWMPDVKVLGPARLRARIVEKLRDGLKTQTSA